MTTLENKFLKPPLAHIMGWKRLIQTCLMSNSIKKGKKKKKKKDIRAHFMIGHKLNDPLW